MTNEVKPRLSRFQENLPENTALKQRPRKPVSTSETSVTTAHEPRDAVEPQSLKQASSGGAKQEKTLSTAVRPSLRPKTPSISSSFIRKSDVRVGGEAWASSEGPKASNEQVEQFLHEAASLAPLAKSATNRSRINAWVSAAAGVAVGIAVGVGLSTVTGPFVGIAAGSVAAAVSFGIFKKLFGKNPSGETLQNNEAAFHANLGATLRAAADDPALARQLDEDPRWQNAVKTLNAHYPGREIHISLSRAYHDVLDAAQGQTRTLWAQPEPSRFDRD